MTTFYTDMMSVQTKQTVDASTEPGYTSPSSFGAKNKQQPSLLSLPALLLHPSYCNIPHFQKQTNNVWGSL